MSIALIEHRQQRKQIARLQERRNATARKDSAAMSLRRQAKKEERLVHWLTKPLPDMHVLGDKLERAGFKATARQFVLRCLLLMLVITLAIAALLDKPIILGLCAGLVLGIWVPFKVIDFRISKRAKAFLVLFPEAIDLIVRGLRSGLPVAESITLVTREVADPVGPVFGHIANTMKLGVPMEKALVDTAKRLGLTEFNFFTTSIILQRETGGNLGEILSNLSDVLRSRFLMRMKIKAMSSEAKASSIIVGALPFVVMGAVSVMSPTYLHPLFHDYRGNIAGLIAIGMLTMGMWVMRRMTQFEI